MRTSTIACLGGLALVALAGCTGGGRSTVTGVTQYRVCGGVQPEPGMDPCQPAQPVAATVTVQKGETVVAHARSDASGRFRLTLAAGEYTAVASLDPGGPFVHCAPEVVVVPTTTPVTLTCSLLAP